MHSHDQVSRFYGLPITPQMQASSVEGLTDPSGGDLVKDHLRINYSYFGAIDKTLSGFFILDSEGDNYTLLDVRGDGRVWWQDHETRELYPQFDSLEDWTSFAAEVNAGGDEDKLRDAHRTGQSAPQDTAGTPGTATLAERYQWLVWLLSQPLRDDQGRAVQTDDELAERAVGHLSAAWPTHQAAEEALEAELPGLAGDPHLAVYWLLHTSLLALEEQRARVLAAIGRVGECLPLVDAFVAVFGALPLDGDVPVVPGFRARRSLTVLYASGANPPEKVARAELVSMEIAPDVLTLAKFHRVLGGLEHGALTDAEVAAAVARMDATPGTCALRALLDKRAGRPASAHADEFARTAATSGEDWPWVLSAVWEVHCLIRDAEALAPVVGFLLGKDPYHRRVLALAGKTQELAGHELFMPADELERSLALAEASAAVLTELQATPEDCPEITARIAGPELTRVVARRILHRADVDGFAAEVSAWAIRTVLESADADRAELVAEGFGALAVSTQAEVLAEVTGQITSGDHPFVGVLLRVLEHTDEPDDNDWSATITVESMKKKVLGALAPFAHRPEVFDGLMRLAELPATGTTVDKLWNELFNPSTEETYVLPRLTADQAVRVARAMVVTKLTHPSIHARNAAGHQLYRFDHAGAQEYLIGALDKYGLRFAAPARKSGKVFDHGQTEDALLEDLVANLYSAVRNMNSPRSRTALTERLFTERRAFWRMGNAIGVIFSDEVHHEAMSALRVRRDGMAAGCYAYTLADFVEQGQPKVELLRELVGWPVPQQEIARRFFKYALVVGIEAALAAKTYELVRTAHSLASSIAEQPLEPDEHARGMRWDNPLERKKTAKRLAAVLSGAADTERRRLLDKGVTARAAGKPRRKISDNNLGILAGVTVGRRILHDAASGEVWFLDSDGTVHAFDGYEITGLPFQVGPAGEGQMREFLTGATELSERALFWDRRAEGFAEFVRYGDRITCRWGRNNSGAGQSVGLAFPGTEAAAEAFARLRSSTAASGMAESSPWYVPGKGAVMRSFRTPSEGSGNGEGNYRIIFDGRADLNGPRYATEAEAIAAHQQWELEAQRDRNASLYCLEWRDGYLRPEDMTVRQWIRGRTRDGSRDAVWHARALTENAEYLTAHGYGDLMNNIEVELGSGVGDDEIAAFEAERQHPVPEDLRAFWREIGHARWSVGGDSGMRVLSPAQMLARRPALRELGQEYLGTMPPSRAENARPVFESLDLLVESFGEDPAPVTVVADLESDDGRVFAHTRNGPEDLRWGKSLAWMLATEFGDAFADAIEAVAPVVAQLYHGQQLNPHAERRYFELRREGKPARYWELFSDQALDVVSIRTGKVGTVGAVDTRRYRAPARAARKAAKLIAAKLQEGYRETSPAPARDGARRQAVPCRPVPARS
ncbi:WGR domain-containing protein [Streptomyces sp. NPDC057474]|uniref:WGR domain-containing protein n=1 Tax=Streptomyces sp. NPDC057474 TaxID=3346144 RepID=UPI00367A99D4